MYGFEYDVRHEQNEDLKRNAKNGRLIRQARANRTQTSLSNARNAIGRSLVQLGQSIINER